MEQNGTQGNLNFSEIIERLQCIKLKTTNPCFTDVWQEKKKFDIRCNDRNFKTGQFILFNEETDPQSDRRILVLINYILYGGYGLQNGYCCFGFKHLANIPSEEEANKEMPNSYLISLIPFVNAPSHELYKILSYRETIMAMELLPQNNNKADIHNYRSDRNIRLRPISRKPK